MDESVEASMINFVQSFEKKHFASCTFLDSEFVAVEPGIQLLDSGLQSPGFLILLSKNYPECPDQSTRKTFPDLIPVSRLP